jgi:hypothetical protein
VNIHQALKFAAGHCGDGGVNVSASVDRPSIVMGEAGVVR